MRRSVSFFSDTVDEVQPPDAFCSTGGTVAPPAFFLFWPVVAVVAAEELFLGAMVSGDRGKKTVRRRKNRVAMRRNMKQRSTETNGRVK